MDRDQDRIGREIGYDKGGAETYHEKKNLFGCWAHGSIIHIIIVAIISTISFFSLRRNGVDLMSW